MTEACGRRFDEELLSGYVDRVLGQGERQQVELHLEGCGVCRALVADLTALRQAARATTFQIPPDEQWRELPRSGSSRALRLGGWSVLLLWVALVVGLGLVELWRSPLPAWERVAIVGGAGGFLLLLLSVLLDRLHDLKSDRYTRVQR